MMHIQAWAPNTIEIGGIHCREGQSLPPDLKLFMDSHPEGVIYVSFGSTVKPSLMSSERKQIFIDTFRNELFLKGLELGNSMELNDFKDQIKTLWL